MTTFRTFAICLLVVLVAPAAAAGQGVTRGNPLTAPNTTAFGCESSIQQDFDTGLFLATPMGHPSCTWWSSGIASTVGDPNTGYVPTTGTVTNVRVKAGANPAPLRIVQLRSTAGCCVGVRESPPFQPAPNAITQVSVNWPVEVIRDSVVGVSTNDIIGFSAIGGTGTLPISDQGLATHSASASFAPGVHTGTMTVPSVAPGTLIGSNYRAAIGYEPLLQYDFVPCPALNNRPAAPCPTPPPAPTPPIAVPVAPGPAAPVARQAIDLRSTVARLRAGRIALRVACLRTATCRGRLRLRTAGPRPRLLVSQPLVVPGGASRTVQARLTAAQRQLLLSRATTPLTVELDLGPGARATERVTFRR